MNERIEELAEQAGPMQEVLTKISEQTDDKGPRYVKNIGLLDFQLGKFAELIVRECALIAKTAAPYSSDDLILKRFGFDQ